MLRRLRLANSYDLSTHTIIDGVELDVPAHEPIPKTVEQAHALLDRMVSASGDSALQSAIQPHQPVMADYAFTSGRNLAVEKAVKKARVVLGARSAAAKALVKASHMVDCTPKMARKAQRK